MNSSKGVLFEIKGVRKTFRNTEGQDLAVLENVDLTMHEGEIVALLGKSGAGKSTLLRIIAGLIKPTSGEVSYRGNRVNGPVEGISMVFQNFALMPWLTVLQNVELGLEAKGLDRTTRRKMAIKAIDMIGLDGFESAYPKELSGGMRQRVGFARALVVEPELLVMDEPFSALDVLTADNLRNDLLDLWQAGENRTKGILFVTHNIEEAALIADRIIIFASDPGHIKAELLVTQPKPRQLANSQFRKLVDDIYTLMTSSGTEAIGPLETGSSFEDIDVGYRLPDVELSELTGLVETLASAQGPMDLPDLADYLHMDADDLFPLTEALELLNLAMVSQGDIMITEDGKAFAKADILGKKHLFAQFLTRVPLARHIRQILDKEPSHRVSEDVFINELREYLSENESERVLKVIIDWGRYAEVFAYDFESGILSLDNPK